MEQNNYVFRVTAMGEEYLPQISYALEKRTELLSRVQCPGMWKATDKLQPSVKEPSKGRRIFRKLLSIFCLCCGVLLFVPGLMEPEELKVPLIVGAVSIGTGIGGLLRGKIKRKNPFDKSARLLLEQRKTADDATVAFNEDGMKIAAGGGEELIPYDKMDYIVEAGGVLLLTFAEKVIAVKTDDMVSGGMEDFRSFITEQTNFVPYN